jgi:hypothetical protein
MNRAKILEVMLDQHVSLVLGKYVPRYERFRSFDSPTLITIITGIRRCGKSTLLNEIRSHNNQGDYYLNFDDDRLIEFELPDFQILLELFIEKFGNQNIFYFDEIQNINGWERFVRRLHDMGNKIYITGSNARMLSRELGTHLTGRYVQLELYPFSFTEFATFQDVNYDADTASTTVGKATWMRFFNLFFESGGIPEYIKTNNKEYLKNLYEGILYKDILTRHKLTKEKEIKELLYFIAGNVSKELTQNSLAKTIGVKNASTIKDYLQYFEDSYLTFTLLKFDNSIKRQLLAPRKVYFIDTALAKNISFRQNDDLGRVLENIVFLELKRRGAELFYFKGKKECDFLEIRENNKKNIYQVCYDLQDKSTKKREIDGLMEAMLFFNLDSGFILTFSEEDEIKFEGKMITIKPVWKWLVE